MQTSSDKRVNLISVLWLLAAIVLTTTSTASASSTNPKQPNDEVQPSPSTTSIHQVWTSTSTGGQLGELSPELISKLRQDVPFLAAYALRPRLVGLANNGADSASNAPLVVGQLQAPASRETGEANLVAALQASGSSPQRTTESLVPQLGDFSEFNVETLSTSKSEHQHKRRTSLKRNDELNRKRRVMDAASRLVKKRDPKVGQKASKKRREVAKGGNKRRGKALLRAGRLRSKLNRGNLLHHMSIIKHGRYSQLERQTDANEQTIDDDGVKGGARGKADKKPFYSKAANPVTGGEKEVDRDADQADGERDTESDRPQGKGLTEVDGDNDDEDDGDRSQAAQPSPKRVGDDDVDAEGDTVTVKPKSDGVDDDPDPADYEPPIDESEGGVGLGGGAGVGATTVGGSAGSGQQERDKNGEDGEQSDTPKSRKFSPGVEFADEEADKVGENEEPSEKSRPGEVEKSDRGREEASTASGSGDPETTTTTTASKGSVDDVEDDDRKEQDDDADYNTNTQRRRPKGGKDSSSHEGKNLDDDDDDDLDYRDEHDRKGHERKSSNDRESSSRHQIPSKDGHNNETAGHCDDGSYHHEHGHHHHHHDTIKWLQDAIPGEPDEDYPILSRANLTTNFNCRDQKWPGYYADVDARCQVFHICQADGRQDSFLCPNGTIFSQITSVCVWWNSFDCEDAPKYYKLNALLYKSTRDGTAASEDGPKLPASSLRPVEGSRMALGGASSSRKAAGPYDDDDDGNDDDETSIDSLIRAMRRREMNKLDGNQAKSDEVATGTTDAKGLSSGRGFEAKAANGASTRNKVDSLEADEEATIQRKSTNIEDEDEEARNQAGRLVRRSSQTSRLPRANAERRRKRRASVRQAPPKLKSRRFARPSRRWKLRHNPKPKRRA